ncbi:hypothetical protein [Pseudarthrobacter phenanthrenivorans]|nr:hypothetical protein [Pseudarthrobacter phenanthrenivorans]
MSLAALVSGDEELALDERLVVIALHHEPGLNRRLRSSWLVSVFSHKKTL